MAIHLRVQRSGKESKTQHHSPPTPKSTQNVVRVISVALNPVDYKLAEIPLLGRLLVPKYATLGIDFASLLITPAQCSDLKAVGCHLTISCFKSLGAESVIDYKKGSTLSSHILRSEIDEAVDNVGADPDLYWQCHGFTKPGSIYIMVEIARARRDLTNR